MNIVSSILTAFLTLATLLQGIVALIEVIKHFGHPKRWLVSLSICVVLAIISGSLFYASSLPKNPLSPAQNTSATSIHPSSSLPPTATSMYPSSSPSPTATSTPVSEATPTATSLPTGVADCSGGQNVGWDKWISDPESAWINYGAMIENHEDQTNTIAPTLLGPACGLLKIGSRISINFKMQRADGDLYLLIQGTDSGWYGIQFTYSGPNIIADSKIISFAKQYILKQGNTYSFKMEIATNGNINLLNGNDAPILSYGAAFIPNGYWGLKTFYGIFAINSISV